MSPTISIRGFCCVCDVNGQVQDVLEDNSGLNFPLKKGKLLATLLGQGNLAKALDFLLEIKKQGCAFDWKFSLNEKGKTKYLYCGGIQSGQRILIFGARHRPHSFLVYQKAVEKGYIRRMNTDDPAAARSRQDDSISGRENLYFDEMTRLNNELANLQRAFAKKNLDLEKLNKLKNQFLGMAAHDIRNSLWVIQLSSRVLIQETESLLNEEQLDSLNMIFKSSKSVQKVVDKFLNLVNITEGKIELNYQHLDIMLLISHCTKLNKALAQKKQITFAVSPKNKEIEAWIDPSAMEQVLNNLLSNAIKYSPTGGVIRINVKVGKDDIQLSVKDKGEGIPTEKQKNVFEPFVRDNQQRLRDQKSFGLGLAIVKKLVDTHKGRVWIKSKKNEGTTFIISLPKS